MEEAEWVIDLVRDYSDMITYPVVFDLEKMSPDSARMNALSPEERTMCAIAFLDRIAEEGYIPMLYGNLEMFAVLSDSGSVNGIGGNVDMDLCFTDKYK